MSFTFGSGHGTLGGPMGSRAKKIETDMHPDMHPDIQYKNVNEIAIVIVVSLFLMKLWP